MRHDLRSAITTLEDATSALEDGLREMRQVASAIDVPQIPTSLLTAITDRHDREHSGPMATCTDDICDQAEVNR